MTALLTAYHAAHAHDRILVLLFVHLPDGWSSAPRRKGHCDLLVRCVRFLQKPVPLSLAQRLHTKKRTAGGGVSCLGEVDGGPEDDEGVGGDDRRRDGGEVVRVDVCL